MGSQDDSDSWLEALRRLKRTPGRPLQLLGDDRISWREGGEPADLRQHLLTTSASSWIALSKLRNTRRWRIAVRWLREAARGRTRRRETDQGLPPSGLTSALRLRNGADSVSFVDGREKANCDAVAAIGEVIDWLHLADILRLHGTGSSGLRKGDNEPHMREAMVDSG
jgi:hypothetical protein